MKIMVWNSGSSSLKFKLFVLPDLTVTASDLLEEIGEEQSGGYITMLDSNGKK